METALDWVSGIAWSAAYILAILFGCRKKTYAIPALCICLNFSWELWVVMARMMQHSPFNSGFVSQLLWLVLDIGVLLTWLCFGSQPIWKKLLLFLFAAAGMALFTFVADLWAETAFVINAIMSVVFLFRLDRQIHTSLSIAVLKCIGTFPATILNGILHKHLLILTIGGLCLLADLLYIYELWMEHRKQTNRSQKG